jgi:glycosyltransferase involved in cell wall biosynthesis
VTTASPLVSVVIPTWNAARFLGEAIDSVLAQDYPRVELIVVDDGSTDGTQALLADYGARFARVAQPNQGQSAALNRGWAQARGDILSYLGADDRLHPAAVRRAVETLAAHTDCVMSYGDYELMDERSQRLRRVETPPYDYARMLADLVCAPGPGVFIHRAAHEAAGPWDSALHQFPDLDYWLRLGLVGPFRRIPEVLASFRVHEASQSFAADPARVDELMRVVRGIYDSGRLPSSLAGRRAASLSTVHTIAARAHLRAAAIGPALRSLLLAARERPRSVCSSRTLRLLASGVAGRSYYRLLAMRNRIFDR